MKRRSKLQIQLNYIKLDLWQLSRRIHFNWFNFKEKYCIRKQRINRWGKDPAEQIQRYKTYRLPFKLILVIR